MHEDFYLDHPNIYGQIPTEFGIQLRNSIVIDLVHGVTFASTTLELRLGGQHPFMRVNTSIEALIIDRFEP
jgi:hypothetical protein